MFGPIWIDVAQFALSAQSGFGFTRRVFFEEGEGMPLPRERLCQDLAPLKTPNPCQGSVSGKDRGCPLDFFI